MTEKTPLTEEERSARGAAAAADIAKRLFDLVRPEAVALGGALVDRGVRAVANGDIKIRVGAGPAPGKKKQPKPKPKSKPKPKPKSKSKPADVKPTPPVDTSAVTSDAKASTITVEPELVLKPWRCQHCHGTWRATQPARYCIRCDKPGWREGA